MKTRMEFDSLEKKFNSPTICRKLLNILLVYLADNPSTLIRRPAQRQMIYENSY